MMNPCINCKHNSTECVKCLEQEVLKHHKEIAELKLKAESYKEQLAEAKDTISRRNKQVKRTEERLQEVCPHEGESKNGVCLECERYL